MPAAERHSKAHLYMMHGGYGSGKSTFARQLANELPAVWLRSDKIRAELREERRTPLTEQDEDIVFGRMNAAALAALSRGESVIYDGIRDVPNPHQLTKAAIADRLHVPAIIIWMQTPVGECVRRAANRQHDENAVHIEEAEVRARARQLTDPAPNELHIAIDGTLAFTAQHRQFSTQLASLSL